MESVNYVAALNEYGQKTGYEVIFEDVGSAGPDHDKIFTQRVVCNGQVYPEGVGRNKKQAKRNAAQNALTCLLGNQYASNEVTMQSVDDNSFKETNFIGILNHYCQKTMLTHNYIQAKRRGQPHSSQ
nr:PREDICTED: interferon-induced, double-stranded RNA-activated protein kinase-like [Paralichthys olivaceus]